MFENFTAQEIIQPWPQYQDRSRTWSTDSQPGLPAQYRTSISFDSIIPKYKEFDTNLKTLEPGQKTKNITCEIPGILYRLNTSKYHFYISSKYVPLPTVPDFSKAPTNNFKFLEFLCIELAKLSRESQQIVFEFSPALDRAYINEIITNFNLITGDGFKKNFARYKHYMAAYNNFFQNLTKSRSNSYKFNVKNSKIVFNITADLAQIDNHTQAVIQSLNGLTPEIGRHINLEPRLEELDPILLDKTFSSIKAGFHVYCYNSSKLLTRVAEIIAKRATFNSGITLYCSLADWDKIPFWTRQKLTKGDGEPPRLGYLHLPPAQQSVLSPVTANTELSQAEILEIRNFLLTMKYAAKSNLHPDEYKKALAILTTTSMKFQQIFITYMVNVKKMRRDGISDEKIIETYVEILPKDILSSKELVKLYDKLIENGDGFGDLGYCCSSLATAMDYYETQEEEKARLKILQNHLGIKDVANLVNSYITGH